MSKFIEIVDYVDICSTAFVGAVDAIYDSSMYIEDIEKIIINISNPEVKEMFEYYIDKEIQALEKKFGKKIILVNTCVLKNNWRSNVDNIDHLLSEQRFVINDDSLMININLLTKLLMKKWKDLDSKENIFTISLENIDSDDIIQTMEDVLGKDNITKYKTDFKIIEDINFNYFGISTTGLPKNLEALIKNELINNNLLI